MRTLKIIYHLSGFTLNEHIRVRRLSKASEALPQDISVTEATYKYVYQSLEGLTRVYRNWNDCAPKSSTFSENPSLQDTMARIYDEWLPASAYKVLPIPTFSFIRVSEKLHDIVKAKSGFQ